MFPMLTTRFRALLTAVFSIILLANCVSSASSNWPQFRGPNASGVAESDKLPVEFSESTNFIWKIELPSGLSSPVIWGDRIFLTSFETQKLDTICLRRKDGRILWRKTAPAKQIEEFNPTSSPASATPATDGKRVYVYFGSYGVLAYDFDGREAWRKPLPMAVLLNGSGTSPSLMDGRLIINRDQEDGKSSLLALDAKTGRTLWETPRSGFLSSYGTPIQWKRGGTSEVVLTGSFRVVGYSLKDGKERWSARGLEALSVCPTPVIGDRQLHAMSYAFGESKLPSFSEIASEMDQDNDSKIARAEGKDMLAAKTVFDMLDKDKDAFLTKEEWDANIAFLSKGEHGIFAIRAPGSGDVTTTHIAWKQKRGAATVSSPLFYRGRIWVVQDGGRVTCLDARTGKPVFEQERLDADGGYYASPVAANGKIYFASTRGTISVVEVGNTLKVLARNKLSERAAATPAIADNKLYVRTEKHLWAFGK